MQFMPLAFAGMPGGIEWVVIGLVALLLFGKRLPSVARSVGQALTEFKSGLSGDYKIDGTPKTDADSSRKQS